VNTVAVGDLLAMLARIPDPRGRQGRRFGLSAMLATVVCGILTGARGYTAIAEWIQRTGFVLSQQEVDGKTNEHKGALQLLKTIVLKGRLVTGDAMFCQHDLCQQIVDDGGHYFFVVKDNQPSLKEAIAADFRPGFSPLHRTRAAAAAFSG